MVTCMSLETRYQSLVTNGKHEALSDTTEDKGGSHSGFRPHELLEAALASCLNIWLRMYADEHGIPLGEVFTRVSLDRTTPGEVVFEYDVELAGPLTDAQRHRLMQVAKTCPVHQTLSKRISFANSKEA
ncbi:MAG: OsmC family protein [Anaerolineae bacterium]